MKSSLRLKLPSRVSTTCSTTYLTCRGSSPKATIAMRISFLIIFTLPSTSAKRSQTGSRRLDRPRCTIRRRESDRKSPSLPLPAIKRVQSLSFPVRRRSFVHPAFMRIHLSVRKAKGAKEDIEVPSLNRHPNTGTCLRPPLGCWLPRCPINSLTCSLSPRRLGMLRTVSPSRDRTFLILYKVWPRRRPTGGRQNLSANTKGRKELTRRELRDMRHPLVGLSWRKYLNWTKGRSTPSLRVEQLQNRLGTFDSKGETYLRTWLVRRSSSGATDTTRP